MSQESPTNVRIITLYGVPKRDVITKFLKDQMGMFPEGPIYVPFRMSQRERDPKVPITSRRECPAEYGDQ